MEMQKTVFLVSLKIGIKPECSQSRLTEKPGSYISITVAIEANLARNPDKITRYFVIAVFEIQVYLHQGGEGLGSNEGL